MGVLEHDLYLAAERAQLAFRKMGDAGVVQQDVAGGGRGQAKQQPQYRGFAGTGFADDAEGLSRLQRERYPIDGALRAVGAGDITEFEEGGHGPTA